MSINYTIREKKLAILADSANGETPMELSIKYGVAPNTIRGWLSKDQEAKDMAKIAKAPERVVKATIEEIKAKAAILPAKACNKIETELDKISGNVKGLQALDAKFQDTFINLLSWANNRISEDMKISEWTTLVNGVKDLHKTIFSQENTQINIVNNQQNNSADKDAFKAGFRN